MKCTLVVERLLFFNHECDWVVEHRMRPKICLEQLELRVRQARDIATLFEC